MSDNNVQFDFDSSSRPQLAQKTSTIVRLVMEYSGGFIKDEAQANHVLIGLTVSAFVVSLILFLI